MNKFVIIASIAVMALVATSNAMTIEEAKKMMMEVAEGCAKEKGATAEDTAAMKNHEIPTSETGKCTIYCMYENFGIMDGTTINGDVMVEAVKGLLGESDPLVDSIKSMIKACEGTTAATECDTAAAFAQCKKDFAKSNNIEIPM